ncbi:MAG: zinc-ribbon domain-containing protein, partial [Gemmatimonadales bacterium]
MNVTCPNCATVYRVDPAKVPAAGVRARCTVCSAVFGVNRDGREARAPEPLSAAPAPSAARSPAPPSPPAPPPPLTA